MSDPVHTTSPPSADESRSDGNVAVDGKAANLPAPISVDGGELFRARMEVASVRAGLVETYAEVAELLFSKTGKEPTKENLTAFLGELRQTHSALFQSAPSVAATTAPPSFAPATPAPSAPSTAIMKWNALRAAGRVSEAQAYYELNRAAILAS